MEEGGRGGGRRAALQCAFNGVGAAPAAYGRRSATRASRATAFYLHGQVASVDGLDAEQLDVRLGVPQLAVLGS